MAYKFGVISADSHLSITNDALLSHVPSKLQDSAKAFLAANTGNPIGSSGTKQETEDEHFWPAMGRVGQYDPVERLKDMDIDGIDVEVLYTQGDAYTMPAGNPPAIDGMALLGFPDQDAVFPMMQGGPLMHGVAAKAVALKEASTARRWRGQNRLLHCSNWRVGSETTSVFS